MNTLASESLSPIHHSGERRAPVPWVHSLLFRMILGVLLSTTLISVALFVGIDHQVSRQFEALHQERVERIAAQVRQGIERERTRLGNLAALLVNDADLNASTYYHLYLEGERDHPHAAITRMSRAFQTEAIALWSAEGAAIVSTREDQAGILRPSDPAGGLRPAETELRRVGDTLWLIAQAPLEHNSNLLAWLVIAEPLEQLLRGLEQTYPAQIRTALPGAVAEGHLRLTLPGSGGDALPALDVIVPDSVAHALREVKRLLAVILAVSAVLLAAVLALVLRWQMRPVMALSTAITAVGSGDFTRRLPSSAGRGELGLLVRDFNRMVEGLSRLRDMERRLRHEEQLSAIGRVAARVAHDINNPLSVIHSAAAMLKRRAAPESNEYLDLIEHHCERCMRTVENLLEYGRPVKPRLQVLDLRRACREIAQRWQRRREDGTRLDCHQPEEALTVSADPFLLEQMLDNLLDNAAQAAPGETITLTLGTAQDKVWLELQDRGPGFTPEARSHLFEPFFTTKHGGTGLGLASCLTIARAHGGEVEIPAGEGGRVRVWLPGVGGAGVDQIERAAAR
ncbi:sensor histidine kinase [Thioalkalivibrio sulfidiphilus]|uniref:sensor histidine kinase n=1 Tax=Thioalkalivibrio sulfidiphilus TaxID=1033854 RepID=UPI0003762B0A|nr:HAMP domain-containing sensor histidine kinase [Thioalkalivibrio sulfidiphilus]